MSNFYKGQKNHNQINFPTPPLTRQKLQSRDPKKNWRLTRDGKRHEYLANVDKKPQKIEIDESLLFTRTNAPRTANQNQRKDPSNNIIQSKEQDRFYETSKGFGISVERPQSKQQPRSKLFSLSKQNSVQSSGRPQTSKGVRITTGNQKEDLSKRRVSLNNFEDDIMKIPNKVIRKNTQHPLSATTRKSDMQTKLKFETSLDPQFLSLFAL